MAERSFEELVAGIADITDWTHPQKIKFFAWYLHVHESMSRISPVQILDCYDRAHIQRPANIHRFIEMLESRRPSEILRESKVVFLPKHVRDELDQRYGRHRATVAVRDLLSSLPSQIPDIAERAFYEECLVCFENGAFRAAIIMAWILTFDHLCRSIISKHLPAFNAAWPRRFEKEHAKSRIKQINSENDFSELKESQVIEICINAGIVSGDVGKILRQKLDMRNSAAHPSDITFREPQAEEFIHSLVSDVVLKLS
jgi:hypothetical protein